MKNGPMTKKKYHLSVKHCKECFNAGRKHCECEIGRLRIQQGVKLHGHSDQMDFLSEDK
jgi:hypothetical protein